MKIPVFVLFLGFVSAQAFDEFPPGARPAALSGAFTALADDVHSLYYNPAGLTPLGRRQVTVSYAKLFPTLTDQSNSALTFMAYGHPLKKDGSWGTLGTGWSEFRLQDLFLERTILVGYGKSFYKEKLSAGLTLKSLQRKFGEDEDSRNALKGGAGENNRTGQSDPVFSGGHSAQGLALDAGVLYTPFSPLTLGMSLLNFNQPDLGLARKDPVPLVIRTGAAYRYSFLKATLDLTRRQFLDKTPDHRLLGGLERTWIFNRYGDVSVRGGAGIGNRSFRQTTLGVGYEINGIVVDYVLYIPLGALDATGNTHNLSLSFKFGRSPGDQELESLLGKEREALARAEEALRMAEAEAVFIKEDRTQLLIDMETLRNQLKAAQNGLGSSSSTVVSVPSLPNFSVAQKSAAQERASREKALREYNAAYQAAMGAYGRQVQRGASLTTRIKNLTEILERYRETGVNISNGETEIERVKSDLAQAESDYRITLDFYHKNASQGADESERLSLLERMVKKYGRAGIDVSEAQEELDSLKK